MSAARIFLIGIALLLNGPVIGADTSSHSHHEMTAEQFAELRDKVPLYRELTDEQILANMARMGPNFQVYLSDSRLKNKLGILALGHGYEPSGNEVFKGAFAPTASKYPTATSFGMAMMTSSPIQSAVDELTAAGADTILVIPVTTLKVGGLIGQWRYIFNEREDAPWMSVPRVKTKAKIIFGPTPTTDPVISRILLEQAAALSRDPEQEVVALVAHGPDNEEANQQELAVLKQHAEFIRSGGGFAAVRGFTLQDDAPSAIREANIARLRGWVSVAVESGKHVIVLTTLPVKGSVHKKINRDLEGLDYKLVDKGILEHPLFADWVDSVIQASL